MWNTDVGSITFLSFRNPLFFYCTGGNGSQVENEGCGWPAGLTFLMIVKVNYELILMNNRPCCKSLKVRGLREKTDTGKKKSMKCTRMDTYTV